MALGRKTGGRQVGTPNKRTQELQERLEALGVDPVEGLAAIACDSATSLELRARVQMELMAYVYPKRRALDVSAQSPQPISIRIGIPEKHETVLRSKEEPDGSSATLPPKKSTM